MTTLAVRTAPPGGALRSALAPGCYLLLGAALLALLAVTARHGEWVSDSWIHAATLTEVARHPWHPLEPLTGEDVSFAYFSPWAMLLGWAMHVTGAGVWPVLTVAGLVDTTLLLAAWYRLVRAVTAAPWAPVLSLLLMLLLWGTGAWFWSGFPALGTLTVGFAWPSVLAGAAWFEAWRTALRLDAVSRAHRLVAFALLPGLILLVHPFTAVLAAVSVGITLAVRLRTRRRAVLEVAGAAAVSAALAALWPWISLPSMLGDKAAFDAIHIALYRQPVAQFGLLVLTVPALLVRLRRDRADPLFWTAAVCAVGVGTGALTHVWSLGRFGPGIALPGQLALGALLAGAAARRPATPGTAAVPDAGRPAAADRPGPAGTRDTAGAGDGARGAGVDGSVRAAGTAGFGGGAPGDADHAGTDGGAAGSGGAGAAGGPGAAAAPGGSRSGGSRSGGARAATAVLAALTGLALLVGCYANAWAVARALPGAALRARAERSTDAQPGYPDLRWIARYVHDDDVAVSNFWYTRRELPTYRLRVVQTPWPSPAVPDEARRAADEARILGWTRTGQAERDRLLARYRVRWIVWHPTTRTPQWPYPGARLVGCGPGKVALLRIDPSATTPPRHCPA